jgi:hypothetical protein
MITFGKYKGKTLKWIEENDLPYYNWMENNVKNFDKLLSKNKKKKELILKEIKVIDNTNWNDNFKWNEEWPNDINEKLSIWYSKKWYESIKK